jgi:hypothetical protein
VLSRASGIRVRRVRHTCEKSLVSHCALVASSEGVDVIPRLLLSERDFVWGYAADLAVALMCWDWEKRDKLSPTPGSSGRVHNDIKMDIEDIQSKLAGDPGVYCTV